jgi:hypothetical protein
MIEDEIIRKNNEIKNLPPKLAHFQYLLIGLSSELEMNILIDLLQPHSGISTEIEFETEEKDMIAEKLRIFCK